MEFQIPTTGWIWGNGWQESAGNKTQLAYFRKIVSVKEIPDERKIQISADSRYKLYINDRLVCVGPSKGDRMVWYFDEVDAAPYLAAGENVIAVEVLRYPPVHKKGSHSVFRTDIPGLFVKELHAETEEAFGFSTDASWKCKLEEHYEIVPESFLFSPLFIFESRCGIPENAGWKSIEYIADAWENAVEYNILQMDKAVSPYNLLPRTIPHMKLEKRKFAGLFGNFQSSSEKKIWNNMLAGKSRVCIPANSHETVEISAGELTTGYLSLRMQGGSGSTVKLLTSESYVSKDSPTKGFNPTPIKGDRCDYENGYLHGFTDSYRVGGFAETEERYEPFWFCTFRFLQVDVTTGEDPLYITGLDYLETGYPLEASAWVETSDETLKPVWDISLRTLKRCMHETYEDCPYYEQLQYAMDSRSQILYTYMVSADDRLARKCMDDFRRSQRYDGMINCSYPCYGPNVIPGFSIYYIMMLYDHMMFFGDKAFLRQHMGAVDGILEFFNRNLEERGLVGKVGGLNVFDRYWSFIDWTSQWDDTTGMPKAGLSGPITMESLLYIMGLDSAAAVMDYLDRNGMAEEYRTRANTVREAVNRYCVDENGMYTDGPGVPEYSQHCQVFAILTDTVDIVKGKAFLEKTLDAPEEYAQCSVAMAYYLFRAMEKAGLYARTDRQWNLWRDMIKKNLTTCVEDNVNERSDCHAWGALALYELPAVVLGVKPAAPGFKKVSVNPNPGYMTWAKGDVATKFGMVHVEWEKEENGEIEVSYQVPDGMEVVK